MDLLATIGITIGNIATDWSDEIGYEIPEIDPNPYKPNKTLFGTMEECTNMLKQFEPFIDANRNISPRAYCTIPDSEIILPIRTDIQPNTNSRQFPIAEALRPIVQKQVEKWRDNGIIRPAKPGTPHNSPIFPVRKKNAQGKYTGDYRVVIDCRLINAALDTTKIDRFPLPLINLKDQVTNFIDDVTIHTENDLQKHTDVVKLVLDRLTKANLRVNTAKMHFAQKSVFILGFCMSQKGLAVDPRKFSNILNWSPNVENARELSSRLRSINFFRLHLPNLSTLTAPLHKLRNVPNIKAVWTQDHSNIMHQLQQLLVNAPVLSTPNLKYDMCLATDSSAFGIRAALCQVIHNKVYYIGFVARRLAPSETRWGSSKREFAAVAYAFQRFHQLLYGRRCFHLFVDNTGILYLHSKEKINRMIENFYETIYEMDFDITYCMGMKNILADQLSRIFWPNLLVKGSDKYTIVISNRKKMINNQKSNRDITHLLVDSNSQEKSCKDMMQRSDETRFTGVESNNIEKIANELRDNSHFVDSNNDEKSFKVHKKLNDKETVNREKGQKRKYINESENSAWTEKDTSDTLIPKQMEMTKMSIEMDNDVQNNANAMKNEKKANKCSS
ncbi:hypothetical protein [Parasitella parasitica]|uniref:Uncharacterized protein n=1 Tax=Parasitella parasitica TaxID=35722 RepID=A0A0B7N5X5_9FUNG|nr:hypothetical protein [Parasitella parasitica]